MDLPPYHELVRNQLHVRLLRSENVTIGRWWNFADVCSSYWRLYVNNRDGAGVVSAGKVYPLTPQRMHFIPAGVRFTCRCTRAVDLSSIHFDVLGLSPASMKRFFNRPLSLPTDPVFDALRENCLIETDSTLLCHIKALVYLALGRLVEPILRVSGDPSSLQDNGPVTPAIRFIEEHLADDLDTRRLAELCHFSRDHFIRVFRQHVGETPAQYIIDRRIAAASQRLLFTSDSIETIAEATGFPDRFYFSRVFARITGKAPAAYRKITRV